MRVINAPGGVTIYPVGERGARHYKLSPESTTDYPTLRAAIAAAPKTVTMHGKGGIQVFCTTDNAGAKVYRLKPNSEITYTTFAGACRAGERR